MKHYFLVSIRMPDDQEYEMQRAWRSFVDTRAAHKPTGEGIEKLAENVWLIDRAIGVSFLASLVASAEQCGLKPEVRFLMEEQ